MKRRFWIVAMCLMFGGLLAIDITMVVIALRQPIGPPSVTAPVTPSPKVTP